MQNTRTHVVMSSQIIAEIDKIAGKRGRSNFLTQAAEKELRRQRLIQLFSNPEPIWDLRQHPELKQGSGVWIRKLRRESDRRLKKNWAKHNRKI